MTSPDRRDRPPLPRAVAWPLSLAYQRILARRNRAFDAGQNVTRLPVPVISIGNLSVGGTGKTPLVKLIVSWLLDDKRNPAIAMRGYRAAPGHLSDEQTEYNTALADVPVVAQPDRLAGLKPLLDSHSIDCVVLDDGFQHRRIARDLDIVLLDASRNVFADRCLPAGWLREPVDSLHRAHAIVLTHCESAPGQSITEQRRRIAQLAGSMQVAETRHAWLDLHDGEQSHALDGLRGRAVIVACGIGHPHALVAQTRSCGAHVESQLIKPDHHRWTRRDTAQMTRIIATLPNAVGPPLVLTTDKDWATLARVAPPELEIWRPRLAIAFDHGQDELRQRILARCARSTADAVPGEPGDTIPVRG